MAQIKKRSGFWQARIQWMDNDGKRHSKSKAGFKTKKLAQAWAIGQENQLNRGVKIDKSAVFAELFDKWYQQYKEPIVSYKTAEWYQRVSRVLHDYFGTRKISEIGIDDYQGLINSFGKNHAPVSVKKLNSMIRACVKFAILDDYIIKDFTQGVNLVADKSKVMQVDYLNLKEIKLLVNELRRHLDPRFTSYYMILTAIYTGMRLSEIQALTWNDIDFTAHTIDINKSWDAINRSFKETKNEFSKRKIKVNPQLLSDLQSLKFTSRSNMVFLNSRGTIPVSVGVNKILRDLLAKLGIKRQGFHFHSLRHSHVALLLANGIDIYIISKRLGHSNTLITSQTYAYLIDEYKERADNHILQALDQL